MRKIVLLVFVLFLFQSCIPLRIAPNIKDYELTNGKRFKRSLSKRQMFIFEDSKEAEQFYNYVNIKFDLNDTNVYDDIPFELDGEQYFFAFYEVEIPNKTLNLFPLVFDLALNVAFQNEEMQPYVSEEAEMVSRNGNWYLAIEVYSDFEKDCLQETSLSKEAVLKYLCALKKEYLATHNYNETVFKD